MRYSSIICMVALLFISGRVFSQEYFIAFFAERISIGAPVGHAFIGIGKGTPMVCDMRGSETRLYGFYPKVKIEGGKSVFFGPVDGKIADDIKTDASRFSYKKINFEEYLKLELKIEDWKKKKYELLRKDCISFFTDMATEAGDLKIPTRTATTTPEQFVTDFIIQNRMK